MPYPRNQIVAESDRHAHVTKDSKLGQERQLFPGTKSSNQPPRCTMGQKVMLSLQNINSPNVNKRMKPRWLRPFPITQDNDQRNNYNRNLSSNAVLRHIPKTFHIGLLKLYRETNRHELPQRHHREQGPLKDDRYGVEKRVNFRFRQPAREPLYQMRWKGYLPSQDQWIHSDEMDEEFKFRFWQGEDQ